MKVLQVNINHSRATQDLAIQKSLEDMVGVLCVSEPYNILERDAWFSDNTNRAAILGFPRFCNKIKRVDQGDGFVAAKIEAGLIYSCYISPNSSREEYEQFLQNLSNSLTKQGRNPIIITGDFNAKHKAWGSKRENNRGQLVLEWIVQHKLIILNEGQIATCYRHNGESIIDLSLCTENISGNISNWRVHEDSETLSDHRYISFELNKVG